MPAGPVASFAAMLACLPSLQSLQLHSCETAVFTMPSATTAHTSQVVHTSEPQQLLALRRLDIQSGFDDMLPDALLQLVSPSTLTRLHLSLNSDSASSSCTVMARHSEVLQQLPRLQQLQRCQLSCGYGSWQLPAAALTVLAGLSQLTHLCLEGEGLDARDLALTVRQLYHKRPDALPQLRELELKTCTRMPGVAGANDADETSVAACGVQRGGCGLRASGCDGMRLVAEVRA